MFPTVPRIDARCRILTAAALLCLLSGCDGSKKGPPSIGEAYAGPASLSIREDLALKSTVVATVKHGDRMDVLQTRRRFVRVRTSAGAMGWVDSRQLLSTDQMESLKRLFENAGRVRSQGAATVLDVLNVHVEPSRVSPSFAQISSATPVEVIGHRLAPKVAPAPPPIAVPPKPVPSIRRSKSDAKRVSPPMPAPPALPPNWLDLSRSALPAPGPEEELARESDPKPSPGEKEEAAEKAIPMEDWGLVRLKDGRAGWVLFRNLYMSIPDDVAQYAEGHRITSYFALGEVMDEDQKKHDWLWTTLSRGAQALEFDGLRVFTWNLRRHRYETAYRERSLRGYYPLEVQPGKGPRGAGGTFSIVVEDDAGFWRKTYAFDGRRVTLKSTEPAEAPSAHSPDGIATASTAVPRATPEAAPTGMIESLKERVKSVLKK